MDSASLDRLLRLAKKTGDRLIIHDSATEESMVLLSLDAYEQLVDSSSHWQSNPAVAEDDSAWPLDVHDGPGADEPPADLEFPPVQSPVAAPVSSPVPEAWHAAGDVLEDVYGLPPSPPIAEDAPLPIPSAADAPAASWKEEPVADEPVFYEEPV